MFEIYSPFTQNKPFIRTKINIDQMAILCVQRKSIYSQFSQVNINNRIFSLELYDKKRDSTTFPGGMAVIAHPPCRLFGKLSHNVNLTPAEMVVEKNIGYFCANAVITNGGILEQPFDSSLFSEMNLPPGGMANPLGFTIELSQRMFGHSMIKNTWLFFSKINYHQIEPFVPAIHNKPLKPIYNLSHKQREATPFSLAKWLLLNASKIY